jgi:predicted amidohydrolase YtcJ
VAVGDDARIRALGRGVRVFDAGGRGVVPGFVDTHLHLEWSSAATRLMVDLWTPPAQSIAEVLARLKIAADKTPPGKWVVAEGPITSTVAEKRLPTIDELDTVTQRHPLVVFNGVHSSVSNTLGARGMGYLTAEQQSQQRLRANNQVRALGFVERDAQGRPTTAYDTVAALSHDLWSVDDYRGAIRAVAKEMFVAGGVTSASTMGVVNNNEFSADQALHASGELPLRIRAYFMEPISVSMDGVLDTGMTRGFGNDMFRLGGFKLFMDSSHPGAPTERLYTPGQFLEMATKAHARGFQVLTHCTSVEGAEFVTAGLEELYRRFPRSPIIHHRIEHHRATLPLARRIKAANAYFSLIAPQVPTRNARTGSGLSSAVSAPFRSYVREGIHPIMMSDKCGGGTRMPRPMFSLAAACNTFDEGGICDPGETLEFDDALRIWTLWSAQSSHQDHDRGTITPGKLGDFAVLSGDPRGTPAQKLFDLKVEATILGGRVVYGA